MDRFMSLSVFVSAVEEGSIAAAGRRFGLSAVMAGRYLSTLEKSLSVRLIERTTHKLNLTDAGQAYFVRSKHILEALEQANEEAADRQTTPRGALRIAAPVTFGSMYLGPVIAKFMADFPEIEVALQLQDRFVSLVEEGVDIAVRIGTLPDSDLVARKITDYRLMACASPGYLAKAGMPERPSDLQTHQLLGYIGAVTAQPWSFVNEQGQPVSLDCRCRFLANNTAVMLDVALCGTGIVYGPDFVFARALAEGTLVPVLPAYTCPALPLHAITPTAKHVNFKTRLFIDRLKQAFGTDVQNVL
ncbi:LysR family transcriptional regulator [Rahnella bruchi]|uniref:LysR family transcriptional regulator n=1 Tax=Rahnella bruchi TaxID=1510573 RepID=UPI000EA16B42|nr:LysR family transcriptional regulator [Rahnella bruchi]